MNPLQVFSGLDPWQVVAVLIGGITPAVVWLFFWLREDALHPEPKRMILLAFILGALGPMIAFPLESATAAWGVTAAGGALAMVVLSVIEESIKFGAFFFAGLKSRFFDEPIDAVIYNVTVALGFAGAENAMFLAGALGRGHTLVDVLTMGDFRFLGATVLHAATSAILGVAFAEAFYERPSRHAVLVMGGFIGAVSLHTIFNLSIMNERVGITTTLPSLWLVLIAVLFLCEKIKRMAPRTHVEEGPLPRISWGDSMSTPPLSDGTR